MIGRDKGESDRGTERERERERERVMGGEKDIIVLRSLGQIERREEEENDPQNCYH